MSSWVHCIDSCAQYSLRCLDFFFKQKTGEEREWKVNFAIQAFNGPSS